MRTQDKYPPHTYKRSAHNKSKNNRRNHIKTHAKKKSSRQLPVKLALSASVFTLTIVTAAGWQILKTEPLTFENLSVRATALPSSDTAGTQSASFAGESASPASSVKDSASGRQRTDDAAEEESILVSSASDDWNLILVNAWNPLPEQYEVPLTSLSGGHAVDSRCYPYLQQMMDDCRAAGLAPVICSSYRTTEKQEALFEERIQELTAQGYSYEEAESTAATSVARPGTSEHQAGLAVDIVDESYQILDSMQEYTPVQQWLMENCWKYGFILRYPNEKSSLTGIIYEPWHYRYVGQEAAEAIYERGICLEEYLTELS